jgi:hypothetical protein
MKKFEQINDDNYLKIHVYYHLGGMNYFTYKQEARGYYLSVTPVKLEQGNGYTTEVYSAFSGIKTLLLETKRKSDKAMQTAEQLAINELPKLKSYVLSKMQNN